MEKPSRVIVEQVRPQIDCGRFPIKRVSGERVEVTAAIYADGHEELAAVLRFRREGEPAWREARMTPLGNDLWRAAFEVEEPATWRYQVVGWLDTFATWSHDLKKRVDAGQDVAVDLRIGAALVEAAATRAQGEDEGRLRSALDRLAAGGDAAVREALSPALAEVVWRRAERHSVAEGPVLAVTVERERARFSAWYELFPRSLGEGGRHGTLDDVIRHLPYVASMGFDVLYLPPIHPIGRQFRKGRNNSVTAGPNDPGSPWAIGGPEGGHKAVHPQLGTLDDFRRLVARARDHELEIALDIAFQCSPDHPYVKEHPEWFRARPDGTIQYAENPPKKYQDIYPFDFDTPAWRSLWDELLSVFTFWMDQGVRVFRVDNPHTKALPFWEWCIARVKEKDPGVIFLSEAFTRPHVMYGLAKLGFTQSYTYFTWRTTPAELRKYMTELTTTEVAEYFRPNFWPNTPDILPEHLQVGGLPAFRTRALLASTLAASWGIYGPAFELGENEPLGPGKEEYLSSEKYELRQRDLAAPHSLRPLLARLNAARRDHPPLMRNDTLRFHETTNDQLLCYSKTLPGWNPVLCVVSFDPVHRQSGFVELDLEELGVEPDRPFQVHDLLTDQRFLWSGPRNYVELDPAGIPGHVFAVRRHLRTEQDFDYFS